MEYLLESVRTAVEFDAAGVFVLNRRVPLGLDTGGRLIAGMATVGFDDTPRDEDPMLRRGEGIIGHVIATGQTVIAPDVRLNPSYTSRVKPRPCPRSPCRLSAAATSSAR